MHSGVPLPGHRAGMVGLREVRDGTNRAGVRTVHGSTTVMRVAASSVCLLGAQMRGKQLFYTRRYGGTRSGNLSYLLSCSVSPPLDCSFNIW